MRWFTMLLHHSCAWQGEGTVYFNNCQEKDTLAINTWYGQ